MRKKPAADEMPKSNVDQKIQKMYECSACTSVFILIQYRRPESMPCLHEPLHCPYCMSRSSLIRIHASFADNALTAKNAKEANEAMNQFLKAMSPKMKLNLDAAALNTICLFLERAARELPEANG